MLYTYTYRPTPLDALHRGIRKFMRGLRTRDLPTRFVLASWCEGELLKRAQRAPVLKKKIVAFYKAYRSLDAADRGVVQSAFSSTNSIRRQLSCRTPRYSVDELPEAIRDATSSLFNHLFENTLSSGEACRKHWRDFYESLAGKHCPFCGLEILHSPELYKQDYDHILCKSRYPFAAVNLRNLAPMGSACNRIFKGDTDVVFDGAMARKFPDPFGADPGVSIDLTGSRPPQGSANPGHWNVGVSPSTDELETWEAVFKIRDRYANDYLEPKYSEWVKDFIEWAAGQRTHQMPWTGDEVREYLRRFAQMCSSRRLHQQGFLKSALFHLLAAEGRSSFLKACARQLDREEGRVSNKAA